jgi:hypothetical protein
VKRGLLSARPEIARNDEFTCVSLGCTVLRLVFARLSAARGRPVLAKETVAVPRIQTSYRV